MNDFLLRMKSLLGDEFDEFLKFYNSDDFIKGLRVNTLKCLPEKLCSLLDFELKKTPFCDEGFYIPSDVKSIGNNPLHHAGAFYVQEPSATSAVTMLDVHEGDYVLDLCAAPGGKSTQIGAKLNGTGLLWSNEIVFFYRILNEWVFQTQLYQTAVPMNFAKGLKTVLTGFLLTPPAAVRECSARMMRSVNGALSM